MKPYIKLQKHHNDHKKLIVSESRIKNNEAGGRELIEGSSL